MDKMKPLMATQMYWSWKQLPAFKEHTVHVNTESIMHSVSTQLHTFWVPCTMSMASWVRSHWPGTLWIAHTRLRASLKAGNTNILPFPTSNSFQLLCWKTWNIFSHHSNLLRVHRNLPWRATYKHSWRKRTSSFPLFQADWLGLNHFITEPEKTQWLIFTLLVHRPNFEAHCCFYYASWLSYRTKKQTLSSGWGIIGYQILTVGLVSFTPLSFHTPTTSWTFLTFFQKRKKMGVKREKPGPGKWLAHITSTVQAAFRPHPEAVC